MRRRRVERCLLRAEVALEAGFPEDARVALEEARRLDPSTPDFQRVQDVVVERQQTQTRLDRARRRRRIGVAAVVVLVVATTGGAWLREPVPGSRFPVPGSGFEVLESEVRPSEVRSPEVQAAALPASSTTPAPPRIDDAAESSPEPRTPNTEPRTPNPEYRVPSTEHRVPSTEHRVPNTESRTPNTEYRTPSTEHLEPRLSPISPVLAALPEAALPTPVAAMAEPRPAAEVAPPAVDEGPRVRAALARYEAAYSALNVSAAQAVWPAVDARSLSRAFNGLESQRLSLGQCALAIDGATARADCNGTATWTPKIGGGTQTEPRNWKFELKNMNGVWQIVRAQAR